MQLTTTTSTPTGTYTIYLVGTYTDPGGNKFYQYVQTSLTVVTGGKPFSIATAAGSPLRVLSPGATTAVNLTLTNPNPQILTVTNLTVLVSSTSAGAACAPDNFQVTQFTQYPLTLPSNGSITLSTVVGSTNLPLLRMLDLPRNQDACKGVSITLAYSGSAQGT